MKSDYLSLNFNY